MTKPMPKPFKLCYVRHNILYFMGGMMVPPGVISGGVASAQMARYLRHHPLTPQDGLAVLVLVVVIVAVVLWMCKHWY